MKRIHSVLALATALLLLAFGLPQAHAFTHPSIPCTADELATIKANLDKEPWKQGYAQLAGDSKSQLTYAMNGPAVNVSRAGSYDQYLGPWQNDMTAVYNLARMWYFTGNPAYAQKARDILLAWATTHTSFSGNESGLALGDYAVCYAGGASILRGTWSGWTTSDTTTVQNYFLNVLWPASLAGGNILGPANKGAIYLEAGIAITVFCDDTAKFNQIVNLYRTFHGSGLMNTLATGQMGETGRDAGHAFGSLNALAFVAECAWKQGVDLYSELDNRLLACGEYYARNTFTTDNPYVPYGTIDWPWFSNAPGAYTANRGTFHILQNAYKNRKNLPTPWIDRKLEEQNVDGNNFMYAKTADSTTATVAPASFPTVSLASSGLTLTTLGSQTSGRSASYANGVWTLTGLGNGVWSDTTDDCQFAYTTMTGDCAMVAKVNSFTNSGTQVGKSGLMIRDNLSSTISQRALVDVSWTTAGASAMESHMRGWTENWGGTGYDDRAHLWTPGIPYWLKIERRGKQITTFASPDGTSWMPLNCTYYGNLPSTLYIGLFLCSGTTTAQTATFSNVAFTGGTGGLVTTPAAPAGVLAIGTTDGVTVRWLPSYGATAYDLLRSTTSGSGYTVIAADLTTDETSYVDTTASAGTTYYYVVQAKNSAGTSGNSSEFGATPLSAPMIYLPIGGISSANFNSGAGMEGSDKAFNRDPGSKWFNYSATTGWIQYDLGANNAQVVKRYTLNSADVSTRNPKNWNFLGSQDGVSWTTLDSQSNQAFAYTMQQKAYDIGNTTAYRFYRLDITANNGATGVAISELGLWATDRTFPNGLPLTAIPDDGQIVLNWIPNTTSTYTVKRSTTSGGPYTTVASGLTGSSYTDTGLTNNVVYYYVVSDATGFSSPEVAIAPSALRVRLKFDESGGALAADSSGRARHAVLFNGPTFSAGTMGNALNFAPASSQYAMLPNDIVSGLTDFTISTWIKVNAFATWQRIFDFGSGTTNFMNLTTQYTTTAPNAAKLRFAIRTPSVAEQAVLGTGIALTAGTWTHVAVTRSGNTVSIYVNGSLAGSGTLTLSPANVGINSQNYLGKSQYDNPYLNAALDDFRLYSQALSTVEIASLVSGQFPAPQNLAASGGDTQVSLSWQAVTEAGSYIVKRSTTSGGPYAVVGVTSSTSYTDTTAAPGTTYYYVVAASNTTGASPDSAEASALTIPAAPTGLTTTPGNGQISLSWNASAGTSGYTILRATSPGGPYTTLATGVTDTSYTDTTTLPGWTYYYAVVAGNGSGQSQSSASATTIASTVALSWLKLDETSGTTAADATGGNNAGTLANGATWIGGHIGNALALDGTSQYASLPGGLAANLHDFTVATWVYWNGGADSQRVFDFGSDTSAYMLLTPKNGATGNPRFAITTSGGSGEQTIDGNAALTTGWHHVAVTLSGSTGTLYVDGQQVGQNTALTQRPSDLGTTTQNWIGRSQYGTDPYLAGRVDDFRLYAGALSSTEIAALAAPIQTSGLAATGGSGQIALAWTATTGATGYTVRRATTSGGAYTVVVSGITGTTYTDTGLTDGTTYFYVVTPANTSGDGANSAEASTATIPAAPTGLTATGSVGQIALTWTASTGATSYNVLRATSSNGSYTTVATGLTDTSYTDTGLANGTTYYYAVTATNASGSSANSTQVNAITAPDAPGSVTATAGDGQVSLGWAASTGATSYTVLRATSPNGSYTTVATGLAGTSHTDTGLSNGTTYYYAVVATNGSGSSANSSQVNAITAPAAPTGLAATPDNAQVSLLWNSSTGAATYNVLRSTTSGSGYTSVATGLTGTSYTNTGLTNGTTYYYVVTATNTGGTSANSSQVSATPVALPSPWATSDIGSTGAIGSASRSPSGVFTVIGAGADIWGSNDAFRYVYQTATGDCDITARVVSVQTTHNAAKGGVMIRESLNANSRHAMTNLTAVNGLEFLRRTSTGGSTGGVSVSGLSAPYWVRLVRSGNTFTSYRSSDGVNWTTVGSVTITMSSNVYIGLLVCSHVNATLNTSTFDNVTANP